MITTNLYKYVLLAWLLCVFNNVSATNIEKYDSFFLNLKSFEFYKANQFLDSITINDKVLEKELRLLSNLLYYSNTGDKKTLKTTIVKDDSDAFLRIVNSLNLGYFELYFNQNKSKAYNHFYNAIEIAKMLNYVPLQKRSYLAMLEYFSLEIARNNKNYTIYLKQYQSLNIDFIDEFWITIYELDYYSSHVKGILPEYYFSFKKLDSLHKTLKLNNSLKPKFFFEKGLRYLFFDSLKISKKSFKKALKKSINMPYYNRLRFSSIIKISDVYYKEGAYIDANEYIKNIDCCLDKYDSLSNKFYIQHYKSKFLSKLDNYKEAYYSLERSTQAGFQLDFRKNTLDISRLQIELETTKKEKQIILQQTQLKEEQRQQRSLWIGGSLALLFSSLLGFLIYKNTKRKQLIAEQERELEIQKTEKILKNQELTTIDAMIAGQEKERQLLASDLHDSVGATLSAARLQFEYLQKNRNKIENEEELFIKTGKLLEEAYQEVRSMAHVKNSGVIAKRGLLPAVKKLAKNASVANKLEIKVQDFGLTERIENTLEITIFRIIQELVTNIIKHAKATEATISITQHDEILNIIIEDNGVGFDVRKLVTNEGMGLNSIEKRVEHLEGLMEVDSTPAKGTHILIDIPI